MEDKCRRKKKTMPRTDTYLHKESKLNPRKTSFQLQQNLASAGGLVDSTTVRSWLLVIGQKEK